MIRGPRPSFKKLVHTDFGDVSLYENKICKQEGESKPTRLKQFIEEKFLKEYHGKPKKSNRIYRNR